MAYRSPPPVTWRRWLANNATATAATPISRSTVSRPPRPRTWLPRKPPTIEPTRPSRMVGAMPSPRVPGTSNLARAPMTSPVTTALISAHAATPRSGSPMNRTRNTTSNAHNICPAYRRVWVDREPSSHPRPGSVTGVEVAHHPVQQVRRPSQVGGRAGRLVVQPREVGGAAPLGAVVVGEGRGDPAGVPHGLRVHGPHHLEATVGVGSGVRAGPLEGGHARGQIRRVAHDE